MDEILACYRFQCAKFPQCARASGQGCCLEWDPQEKKLPDGACTKENGYPYFQPGREENPAHAWLRRPNG